LQAAGKKSNGAVKRRMVKKQKRKGKLAIGKAACADEAAEEVLQGQQHVLGDLSQVMQYC